MLQNKQKGNKKTVKKYKNYKNVKKPDKKLSEILTKTGKNSQKYKILLKNCHSGSYLVFIKTRLSLKTAICIE